MTLEESIDAPRIHLEGGNLYYELGMKIPEDDSIKDYLQHPFNEKNLFFGGVNAVTISEGFSDPRRGGTFQIV